MGIAYVDILLKNPRKENLAPFKAHAIADTGAITLCIPEHIAVQLELETLEMREVTVADGRKKAVPYAGPIQVTFGNRSSFSGALVMGDDVLFGAIQMEDMDLIVVPHDQAVIVNPQSPNMPSVLVKGTRL